MKKVVKVIIMLIIFFYILFFTVQVNALNDNLEVYKPNNIDINEANELIDRTGIILWSIRNIGIVISVITLMIIGLKYMLASIEEKARYKETMFPYVIGCIILAGSTTILSYIYDVLHD